MIDLNIKAVHTLTKLFLKDFKKKNAKITTVLFDDKYEMITERRNVKDVEDLTEEKYFVRGSTALMDAIGKTINFMDKEKADKILNLYLKTISQYLN